MARSVVVTEDFSGFTTSANLGAAGAGSGTWVQTNSGVSTPQWDETNSWVIGKFGTITTPNCGFARRVETHADDQYAEATINYGSPSGSGATVGVMVRSGTSTTANPTCYFAVVRCNDPTSPWLTYFKKVVSGTYTALSANDGTDVAWANGDKISIEVEGSEIRLCKNGTPLGGNWTVTDTNIGGTGPITSGYPGIAAVTTNSDIRLTAFWSGNITGGASVAPLNVLRSNQFTAFGSAVR